MNTLQLGGVLAAAGLNVRRIGAWPLCCFLAEVDWTGLKNNYFFIFSFPFCLGVGLGLRCEGWVPPAFGDLSC